MASPVRETQQVLRACLTYVERSFNSAGYLPIVHRVSGGTRMVFDAAEVVAGVALAILIYGAGVLKYSEELQREGWQMLDFAVHGLANIIRGLMESHAWIHLFSLP